MCAPRVTSPHDVRQGGVACPNTRAVATQIVTNNFPAALQLDVDIRVDTLIKEQLKKVEPCFEYFEKTVLAGMAKQVAFYKAVRLFDPLRIDALGAIPNDVETELRSISSRAPDPAAARVPRLGHR